jgi:hypothetical protein
VSLLKGGEFSYNPQALAPPFPALVIAFNVGLINRNELYLFINGNEVKMNTALHQVK